MNPPHARSLAVELFAPEPGALYPLDVTAHLAGVPRRTVLIYCRWQVIQPDIEPDFGALRFDDAAIRTIRHAEYLRHQLGVNLPGIRVIMRLLDEVERLRREGSVRGGP